MELENTKIPLDLSECFEIINEILNNSEDKEWFMNTTEDDAVLSTHHALGEWIRYNWMLWDNSSSLYLYFFKLGLTDQNDMSVFLLRSFYRHIHKKDLKLAEQIEKITLYWKGFNLINKK